MWAKSSRVISGTKRAPKISKGCNTPPINHHGIRDDVNGKPKRPSHTLIGNEIKIKTTKEITGEMKHEERINTKNEKK